MPAVLAADARCLDFFKFFVFVCPIFVSMRLSLSSEAVQNDLNRLTGPLTHKSVNHSNQSVNQSTELYYSVNRLNHIIKRISSRIPKGLEGRFLESFSRL